MKVNFKDVTDIESCPDLVKKIEQDMIGCTTYEMTPKNREQLKKYFSGEVQLTVETKPMIKKESATI